MITNYRFNKENIKAHEVFWGEHYDLKGEKFAHYFYCVYSQEEDKNNDLFRDVVGLLITTNEAVQGYIAKIVINDKTAYVCCDKEVRFISEIGKVQNKRIVLTKKEKKRVMRCYLKYTREKARQLRSEANK